MNNFFLSLLAIFTPQKCIHCGILCDKQLCEKCAYILQFGTTKIAHGENCTIFAILPYENSVVKSLIYKIKSRPHTNLFNYFVSGEKEPWKSLVQLQKVAIVEIPPHTKTFIHPKLRLYPFYKKIISRSQKIVISRKHSTKKQGILSIEDRKRNQKNSMKIVKNKYVQHADTIIIIDDVITTGSSIKEAYKLIRLHYPKNPIFIVTLAYAKKFNIHLFAGKL